MDHKDLQQIDDDNDKDGRLRIKTKFRGMEQDDDVGQTLDDLPEAIANMDDGVPNPEEVDPTYVG